MRPSWDEYFMEIADATAKRATCPRRQVGAVIVQNNRILSTGYNGSPPGLPHCNEIGGCLVRGGSCVWTIHAEVNAILGMGPNGLNLHGTKTMYTTDQPCLNCLKAIIAAGITRIVYANVYNSQEMHDYLDILKKTPGVNLKIDRCHLFAWKDTKEQIHVHREFVREISLHTNPNPLYVDMFQNKVPDEDTIMQKIITRYGRENIKGA